MFSWITISAGILVAGGIIGVVVARARQSPSENFETFRCPGCEQKIRYLSSKAGLMALCPRCKKYVMLPKKSSQAIEDIRSAEQRARVGQRTLRDSWYRGQPIGQA
jgi:hypothetical protein